MLDAIASTIAAAIAAAVNVIETSAVAVVFSAPFVGIAAASFFASQIVGPPAEATMKRIMIPILAMAMGVETI